MLTGDVYSTECHCNVFILGLGITCWIFLDVVRGVEISIACFTLAYQCSTAVSSSSFVFLLISLCIILVRIYCVLE